MILSSLMVTLYTYYTPSIQSMPKGNIVFIGFVCPFVCPSVILSTNLSYNQVLLRNFLMTYNFAATD